MFARRFRVVHCLFTLTLLTVAFIPAQAGSNADNHFCRACGVLMEEVHHRVLEETLKLAVRGQAGTTFNATINVQAIAQRVCEDATFRKTHAQSLVDGCKEIVDKNVVLIGSMFRGEPPTAATTFTNSIDACVTKMNLCDEPQLPQSPYNKCDACLAVVQDMRDVLLRRKGRSGYLSRQHVSDLMDDECQSLGLRHAATVAPGMERVCEELVGDYEDTVLDAFAGKSSSSNLNNAGKALCGSEGLGVCKNRKGVWSGPRSPFALVPKYAAKEQDEL